MAMGRVLPNIWEGQGYSLPPFPVLLYPSVSLTPILPPSSALLFVITLPFPLFPSLLLPLVLFPSLSYRASPPLPKSSLGPMEHCKLSSVVQGRAPTANSFVDILSPVNPFDGNNIVYFCGDHILNLMCVKLSLVNVWIDPCDMSQKPTATVGKKWRCIRCLLKIN